MTCAIIACLKQEELYIKEWLDYHISIGVDHFYLCDNNDSGYEPSLSSVVQEYIDKGIVEVFDYHDVHPIQPHCYDDIYQRFRDLYDWWLVIDIDEFLTIPVTNNNLKEYISSIPDNVDAIYLIWRNYGDNDLIEYDDRPVLERFTKPSIKCENSNKGKTLFRNKPINKIVSQHTISHEFKHYTSNFDYLGKIFTIINNNISITYDIAYLRHYRTKSLEEWIWRNKRGDTLKDNNDSQYPYKLTNFFTFNERTPQKKMNI